MKKKEKKEPRHSGACNLSVITGSNGFTTYQSNCGCEILVMWLDYRTPQNFRQELIK